MSLPKELEGRTSVLWDWNDKITCAYNSLLILPFYPPGDLLLVLWMYSSSGSHVLWFSFLGHYLFLVRPPLGESHVPLWPHLPMAMFWEQTGFSRFSQWWQGAHVRQRIFHNEKETKIASDLICNFPIAARILNLFVSLLRLLCCPCPW